MQESQDWQLIQEVKLTQLPDSLIQWRQQLVESAGEFQGLLFKPGQVHCVDNGNFVAAKQLVVLGKGLSVAGLTRLVTLLLQNGVRQVFCQAPQNVAEVVTVRLELSNEIEGLKSLVAENCLQSQLDFALLDAMPSLDKPGLVLMDMDSTTIQIECIDEIAKLYDVGEEVSAVTALAMQGKLDFSESLRNRVALLNGASEAILDQVVENMPLMPGLEILLDGLKASGWKVAIASGGFTYFAQALKDKLGFDAVFANNLEIIDGRLTGEVKGEIVDANVKARVLNELVQSYGINKSQTVAVGDGANDLVMMGESAMGVAIHAKPLVQEKAAVSINALDLEAVLCLLSASKVRRWV